MVIGDIELMLVEQQNLINCKTTRLVINFCNEVALTSDTSKNYIIVRSFREFDTVVTDPPNVI